jgi:hypothetical protein
MITARVICNLSSVVHEQTQAVLHDTLPRQRAIAQAPNGHLGAAALRAVGVPLVQQGKNHDRGASFDAMNSRAFIHRETGRNVDHGIKRKQSCIIRLNTSERLVLLLAIVVVGGLLFILSEFFLSLEDSHFHAMV